MKNVLNLGNRIMKQSEIMVKLNPVLRQEKECMLLCMFVATVSTKYAFMEPLHEFVLVYYPPSRHVLYASLSDNPRRSLGKIQKIYIIFTFKSYKQIFTQEWNTFSKEDIINGTWKTTDIIELKFLWLLAIYFKYSFLSSIQNTDVSISGMLGFCPKLML